MLASFIDSQLYMLYIYLEKLSHFKVILVDDGRFTEEVAREFVRL
jgi:hypothetical protein